jgi:segregation and condensation protein A
MSPVLSSSRYQVRLPAFEGPLDLLLSLIEREELDITTVSLAQVTGQYLSYLSELGDQRGSDLAAFLVVAARLVLIKSRALLPRSPTPDEAEEEDVGKDLVRQLRLYKQFKEIAQHLHEREEQGLRSYARIASGRQVEPHLDLAGVTVEDLVQAARETLATMPAAEVGEVIAPATVTIWEQIEVIEDQIASRQHVRFRDVLSSAATRMEVIVTLLAVLELVKRGRALLSQERMFGEIFVRRPAVSEGTSAAAPATSTA